VRTHNRKGSPRRLGPPAPGESRRPTAFEAELCGLRRTDRIVAGAGGEISILRCRVRHKASTKAALPAGEAARVVADLLAYWSR